MSYYTSNNWFVPIDAMNDHEYYKYGSICPPSLGIMDQLIYDTLSVDPREVQLDRSCNTIDHPYDSLETYTESSVQGEIDNMTISPNGTYYSPYTPSEDMFLCDSPDFQHPYHHSPNSVASITNLMYGVDGTIDLNNSPSAYMTLVGEIGGSFPSSGVPPDLDMFSYNNIITQFVHNNNNSDSHGHSSTHFDEDIGSTMNQDIQSTQSKVMGVFCDIVDPLDLESDLSSYDKVFTKNKSVQDPSDGEMESTEERVDEDETETKIKEVKTIISTHITTHLARRSRRDNRPEKGRSNRMKPKRHNNMVRKKVLVEPKHRSACKKTRQNYETKAINLLMSWYLSNGGNTPNRDAKNNLAKETGKNCIQISTWFQNARRRYSKKLEQFSLYSSLYPNQVYDYPSLIKYLKSINCK
ncbi:hypothetical protein BDB01DRAFT_847341 [Pilobolus umbonatus]|nr:hypothetical protein BDB01DRAFT_847341 [Pilobolus umbonatus]